MATPILGFTVGFFAFGSLTVSTLSFTALVQVAAKTTLITAVYLSSPAALAHKENKTAPATTCG
jgi:hypothetical protein